MCEKCKETMETIIPQHFEIVEYFKRYYPKIYEEGLRAIEFRNK